jgi:hypothetical protein
MQSCAISLKLTQLMKFCFTSQGEMVMVCTLPVPSLLDHSSFKALAKYKWSKEKLDTVSKHIPGWMLIAGV